MKVVISGATGAIGHALIAECVKQNIEVLALCRKESARAELLKDEVCKMLVQEMLCSVAEDTASTVFNCNLASEISDLPGTSRTEFIQQKINSLVNIAYIGLDDYLATLAYDDDTFQKQFANVPYDVFFHLAWGGTTGASRNDEALQRNNAEHALEAVKLAHRLGCHTFVGAGSQAEYGRVEGKLAATTPTNPENEYGKAKLAAGKATRELCGELSIKHIWTRILSVYGPYDTKTSMIMSALTKLTSGEVPQFTKGEQQWDFLYSMDAAKALLLVAQKGKAHRVYPIGSGTVKALREYIEILRKEASPDMQVDLGAIPYAEKQVMYLCADISELCEDTGFTPKTDFATGIRNILAVCYDK